MTRIKNLPALTLNLVRQYEKLVDEEISVDQAKAISKLAAAIMLSCRMQSEYNHLTNKDDSLIDFMEATPRRLPVTGVPQAEESHKPDLRMLVMNALEGSEPMHEKAIADRMIEQGLIPPDYFEKVPVPQGGQLAILRGTLLGLTQQHHLTMGRDPEGRAVFSVAAQLQAANA